MHMYIIKFIRMEKSHISHVTASTNPPSIIPSVSFRMTTTRPYWLLQENRNHLSLNNDAHLHNENYIH